MANRDDPWARFRRLVTTWLRTPSTWRGLLLAVLLGGAFTWGVIVLGIALTMAESGPSSGGSCSCSAVPSSP